MKALKLGAYKEGAQKLARCLIGSLADCKTYSFKEEYVGTLVGCDDECAVFFIRNNISINAEKEIIIPIDSIKFDPFAAMREEVNIRFEVRDEFNGAMASGLVKSIYRNTDNNCWNSTIFHDGSDFEFEDDVGEITLDIESACLLDGVEVCEL